MSPDWCVLSLLSIHRLRETVSSEHVSLKQKELEGMTRASHGYGGKFGLQEDRMDKVGRRRSEGRTERSLIHPPPSRHRQAPPTTRPQLLYVLASVLMALPQILEPSMFPPSPSKGVCRFHLS